MLKFHILKACHKENIFTNKTSTIELIFIDSKPAYKKPIGFVLYIIAANKAQKLQQIGNWQPCLKVPV